MSGKKKLFISRNLDPDSPFHDLEDSLEIHDMSLLEFELVPIDALPDCDWLFFYSQQGVRHFFVQQLNMDLSSYKMAAFAPKTSKILQEYVDIVHFTGNGKSTLTAGALQMVALGERIAFVRAMTSVRSVQKVLPGSVKTLDLVVYDNRSKEDFSLPTCDYLVFTSPMNAKTYLNRYQVQPGQTIFAIGSSTSRAIEESIGLKPLFPDKPGEQPLMELVKQHL